MSERGRDRDGTEANVRVLVVEDDPASSECLGEMLRFWGHDGRVAESGAQALALAAPSTPIAPHGPPLGRASGGGGDRRRYPSPMLKPRRYRPPVHTLVLVLGASCACAASAQEPVDLEAMNRIRAEGLRRSQV